MTSSPLVFLGGTTGNNPWRRAFIRRLVERGVPEDALFDPVVDDWNDEARAREEQAKADADLVLFYLGDPQQPGLPLSAFSLVEAVIAVCREPSRTIVVLDAESIDNEHAGKVYAHSRDVLRKLDTGARILDTLDQAADEVARLFRAGG